MCSHFLGIGEAVLKEINTGPDFLLRVLWRKVDHKAKCKQNNFCFKIISAFRKQDMIEWNVHGEMGAPL